MRLVTILAGRAWDALNTQAEEHRRAEKRARREEFDRKRRRDQLDAAGFRPACPKRPENWGSE